MKHSRRAAAARPEHAPPLPPAAYPSTLTARPSSSPPSSPATWRSPRRQHRPDRVRQGRRTAAVGARATGEPEWDGKTKVIGDGSTSYTGPQPSQLKPEPLKPGEKPPQFVVFSWDGALEDDDHLFSHFRESAEKYNAHMTFFLTGIYLLPKGKKQPLPPAAAPRRARPRSASPPTSTSRTRWSSSARPGRTATRSAPTSTATSAATKGGGDWSAEEWKSEIDQSFSFVENWKTNTGFTDIAAAALRLSTKELVGGRAPCLEGQKNLLPAAKTLRLALRRQLGRATSRSGRRRRTGIWDFPLQLLPYAGRQVPGPVHGLQLPLQPVRRRDRGRPGQVPARGSRRPVEAYMDGFERVYYGSRAPLFIGNHFEDLERRHLHEGRRRGHQGRVPPRRASSACPSRSSPTGWTSRTRRRWSGCAPWTRRSPRTGRRS